MLAPLLADTLETVPGGADLDSVDSLEEAFAAAPLRDPVHVCQALARIEGRMFGHPTEVIRFSRYLMLERIGQGGIGFVHAAYDPELHRRVAIKFLRGAGAASNAAARRRLFREAQAMARLAHPNVVSVHDVGEFDGTEVERLGPTGGGVFIVMELLEGQTLGRWLSVERTGWRERVGAFLQAGRGLQAAHEAGTVHRDFKPENAIVTPEGRVVVIDFGLACATDPKDEELAGDASLAGQLEPSELSTSLTLNGAVLGTPSYMAPEQHTGDEIDHRSDQYSFCVALYRGLYGAAPFSGSSLDELLRAKRGGLGPSPPHRRWPGRLYRIVRRGLSPDPADRYPGMAELLLELDRAVSRRRQLAAAGALAGVFIASGGALAGWSHRPEAPCDGGPALLRGTWDRETQAQVEGAFVATGTAYAAGTIADVTRRLDAYRDQWLAMHRESCEATAIRHEQSVEVMDLRMACLTRARLLLGATTSLLTSADERITRQAHGIVSSLDDLDRCADVERLQAHVPLPSPEQQQTVEDVTALLAAVRVSSGVGRFEQAQRTMERARTLAATVRYGPLEAELALVEGAHRSDRGDFSASEESFKRAIRSGTQRGQWEVVLSAAKSLIDMLGQRMGDPERALEYEALASGLAHRSGHPEHLASLHHVLAAVRAAQGKYAEAETQYRRSLEFRERSPEVNAIKLAAGRNNLAGVLYRQGRYVEAEDEFRKILALRLELLGPDHPRVAATRVNLGAVLSAQDRHEQALASHRQAVEDFERIMGAEHAETTNAREALAVALMRDKQHAEAEQVLRTSLAVRTRSGDADHPDTARCRYNLAVLLAQRGEPKEAAELATQATEVYLTVHSPKHPVVLKMRSFLADLLLELGRPEDALVVATEAWSAGTKADVPDWPRGWVAFSLARAQWETGGDQQRARALAATAVELLEAEQPQGDGGVLRAARRWRDEHRGAATP